MDPLVEETMDAYGYCYQNPIKLVDPDGRKPGPPIDSGYSNWGKQGIYSVGFGDGQRYMSGPLKVRIGLLNSSNKNVSLRVIQSYAVLENAYKEIPQYNSEGKIVGYNREINYDKWQISHTIDRTDGNYESIRDVTNCYGYVLTGGYFNVESNIQSLGDYLVNSGYKEVSINGGFKKGDILLGGGDHVMQFVEKKGKLVLESYFAGDEQPVYGSVNDVLNYNSNKFSSSSNIKDYALMRGNGQETDKKYVSKNVKEVIKKDKQNG